MPYLDRRGFLGAAATMALASTMSGLEGVARAACGCAQGCVANPAYYAWVGSPSFDLRYRTGFVNAYGTFWGVHDAGRSFLFDDNFHTSVGSVFVYLNDVASAAAGKTIDWVGSIGVGGCDNLPYHSTGRAFDLSRIVFNDGTAVDMRGSWEVAETYNNRLYAAALAASRVFFGPGGVLSAGFDASHATHIHIDDWHAGAPLSTGSGGDRVILRRINKVFGGSAIAVNTNAWTQADANATAATLARFGLPGCYNIFGNGWHTIGLLDLVARHGVANKPAGTFPPFAC